MNILHLQGTLDAKENEDSLQTEPARYIVSQQSKPAAVSLLPSLSAPGTSRRSPVPSASVADGDNLGAKRIRLKLSATPKLQNHLRKNNLNFSAEHLEIVDACDTHSIIVCGPSGAGKTTVIEAIVVAKDGDRVLFIMRTRLLRHAIQQRLASYQCKHADVTTWYGLARHYRRDYDIIVAEEFQDCTPKDFLQLHTFMADCSDLSRLFLVGNVRQALFSSLNGDSRGDSRYLTYATVLFPSFKWKSFTLTSMFRSTLRTVAFINNVLLPNEEGLPLTASHEGQLPMYIYGLREPMIPHLVSTIISSVDCYGQENIALLTPSTRNLKDSPLAEVMGRLTELGYRVAPPPSDHMSLDPDVLRGKITVANYHQFQGIERAAVFVFGIENAYFRFSGTTCPKIAVLTRSGPRSRGLASN
ncbi:P-loop containing nucleoside triphosphate hydrolase protein [Mycena epipterygia]|nr:P-loop containing nucleoside triphosphate hydrolase protein [Mycena epipterygia]